MKTSNIILLVVFASVLIWIVAVFFTAKAKMVELMGGEPIENRAKEYAEKVTVELENFNAIYISGKGSVRISKSDKNKLVRENEKDCSSKIENGILYVNVADNSNVNVFFGKEINNLAFEDKIEATVYNIETDTLKIITKDKAKVNVNNIKSIFLKLKTEDNSEAHFHNINETVAEAEFDLKDKSKVTINNTKGMSISVKKGPDAKYKDY